MKKLILLFLLLLSYYYILKYYATDDISSSYIVKGSSNNTNQSFDRFQSTTSSKQTNNLTFAHIIVPRIKVKEDIYYGHNLLDNYNLILDEDYGVPGNGHDDVILAGHKENISEVLSKLIVGDNIYITTKSGNYQYVVNNISTPYESEASNVLLNSNHKEDLIIYTCFPFNKYSFNDQRYVVFATKITNY